MKLFKRLGFLFAGLCIVSATSVLTVTSCAKKNPYEDKQVGDEISIRSKKDKDNCDAIARQRILCQPPQSISSEEKAEFLSTSLGNDAAEASSQIYWELVHYMCES
jgi:hypothetical protein